jgi:hypothetical protein
MAAFRRIVFILISLLGLAVGMVSGVHAQADDVLHVVISVEGDAYISRYSAPDTFSEEKVLTAGSFVRSSDMIEVGASGRVVVLCANRVTDEINNDLRSPNCAADSSEVLVAWNNVEIYGQQRAAMDEIVYILNPRHTMVLTSQPSVDWSPSASATSFKITLYNTADNSIVWEKTGIEGTHLDYPADQQPLPAVDPAENPLHYQFVVTPIQGTQELRNFDPMRPEGFCIVSARHRPVVEGAVNELKSLPLPAGVSPDVTSFYLAVYYHGRRLFSDAEAELLKILPVPLDEDFSPDRISAQNLTGSPSYYILLGNVLYAQRLPLSEVKPAYERAEQIALALDDTSALATVNEQLADILRGRKPQITADNDPEIYGYYQKAQEYYTALGDTTALERILAKLGAAPEILTSDLCAF